MLNNAIKLLGRHGPQRLGRVFRDLVRVYGIRGAAGLIGGRLRNSAGGLTSPFGPGPVARLADVDPEPVRSSAFRRGSALLIGSLDLPQCRKYRVLQKQEMLERALGMPLPVVDYRNVHRWKTQMQTAGRAILYRIPAGPEFDSLMMEAERLGVALCYDIDDPVFDIETVQSNPNLRYLSDPIQRSLLNDARAFTAAMQRCRIFTVSTPGLRELVNQRFPGSVCHVVPNGVDAETLHFGGIATAERHAKKPGAFRILLPSGSLAHAADTAVAVAGIERFVAARSDTELVTIGHFDSGHVLRRHSRFKELPYMAYSDYMRVLGSADCALVPLVDTAFNAGKSIVRLIDATLAEVPTIASPVGEYADSALKGSFIAAKSPEDWCMALERLADRRAEGKVIVETAKRLVREPRRLPAIWGRLDPELRAFYRGDQFTAGAGLAA